MRIEYVKKRMTLIFWFWLTHLHVDPRDVGEQEDGQVVVGAAETADGCQQGAQQKETRDPIFYSSHCVYYKNRLMD